MISKPASAFIFFALLVAATLAIYLPGLENGLVFDDARLTDGTIFNAYGSIFQLRPRMLSYGSFVWVQALFGEGWWKQRLVNVLLHLGVVGALYLLLRDLLKAMQSSAETGSDAAAPSSRLAALRVGVALFALNPVAVYAVAYLVQRSIVMAMLFVVLACAAWVRGLLTKRFVYIGLAFFFYVCAVLSKETAFMAATLAVPLYIFMARPGWKRTLQVTALSLLAVAAAGAALSSVFGSILGVAFDTASRLYVQQLEVLSPGISGKLFPLSVFNQAALFFHYGFLWFVPNVQWMSIDLRPGFPLSLWAFPQAAGVMGFAALVAASAWLLHRRSRQLSLLGLCLLCPALLYFSEFVTVWVQDPLVLYRSYLWALTLPGIVALALIGWRAQTIYQVGVVLGLLFTGLAVERSISFKDEFSVWSDAADKVDMDAGANAVGRWRPFMNRGAYHLDRESTALAYEDFTRAVALGEPQGSARFNMGMSLSLMKKHPQALESFAHAETLGFTEPALYYQRGETLFALGRFKEAFDSYSFALSGQQHAQFAQHIRMRRAEAGVAAQKYELAISDFTALLEDKPDDDRLLESLGMAYIGKGDAVAALAIFDRLVARRPTATAYYGRAMARFVAADKLAGLRDLEHALVLEPNNPLYKNLRAQIAGQN